jgi:ubiquinone/menaquinone biosynthesis C-methylase UbiE
MTNESLKLVTGRDEVELAYVVEGEKVFLASSGSDARWPSKILREGKAVIKLDEQMLERGAILVSEPEIKDRIKAMFSQKYGKERTDRWYSSSSRIIELSRSLPVSEKEDIYAKWLESEFDSIASNYDEHIFGNEVNYLLRERSLALMDRVFDRPSHLLEIGCGTGTETIELLKKGHSVLAADVSSKMLEIVSEKAKKLDLESRLTTFKVNGEQIETLIPLYGENAFDGIYSTYGAVNCIRSLGTIPPKLHSLLKDDGKLVMGIYNKFCAPEIGGYLAKFKPRSALNRLKTVVPEGESRFCIDIYAYSMPEILRLFGQYFKVIYREGVPVIILPSNFVKYVRMFNGKLEELKRIDSWLGKKWPFSMLGDHFLLVMKPLVLAS